MCDLIDRQAAIDALCAVCGKSCDKSEFVYNAPQDEQVILCPEHYALCTLPSAQPDLTYIIFETLAECGIYGEEATIKVVGTLKRLGRDDLLPPCAR